MAKKYYEQLILTITQLEYQDILTGSNELFDKTGVDIENWDE